MNAWTLWPLAAIILMGCGPPLPDQLLEGRWVRYHYWADQGSPCPEALEEMDRFVDQLANKTGRRPPAGFRIDYYRLKTVRDVRALCQPHASACVRGTNVYSTTLIQDHELTHAFLSRLGQPPLMFTEGIAVSFGCGAARYVGAPLPPVELAPLLDNDAWSEELSLQNYQAAGGFVRWLVERHGLEAFLRFYETTPSGVTRAQLDGHFREIFGVELADALSQWGELPAARDGEFCMPLEDKCDREPDFSVTGLPSGSASSANVSCVEQVSVLEVGAVPMTRLRFIAEQEGRRLRLRPCSASGTPEQQLLYLYSNTGSTRAMEGRWTELWATLKPGRYSLTVDAIPTLQGVTPLGGSASIEVSAQPSAFGQTCAAGPIVIGDDTWSIAFLHDGPLGADAVVHLNPRSDRKLAGLFGSGFIDPVSLCTGCETPTACQPINAGEFNFGWLRTPTTSARLTAGAGGGPTFLKLVLEYP